MSFTTGDRAIMSLSILLVEDSPSDAAILIAAFEDVGCTNPIRVVTNGIDAIAALEETIPQLILLDLNLPKKNGLEEIKQHPIWLQIPTVVLSSSSSQSDIDQCYQRHANAYFAKPMEFAQYRAMAKQLHSFWLEAAKLPTYELPFNAPT